MKTITRQAEYITSQPIPHTQSIRCFTTTNDSIFKENRAYNTRCEPYTQTVEQKCAKQRARSKATGMNLGTPLDPECQ